jgi:glycine/D-amino acid oxidase-like deaminating enzyme
VRTVEAFAALARDAGATTRIGLAARELVVERGRVVAVATDAGRFELEQVVAAAGPWTRELLARAGLDLPLRAVRTEQHFVAAPAAAAAARRRISPEDELDARFAGEPEPGAAHPVLLDLDHGYYARCEPRLERTRIGALDYDRDAVLDDPDALDEEVGDAFRRWARAALERRLPDYRRRPDLGAQAAWYTMTPDAQALIGRGPSVENLWVVSGFSGHGFKLAPVVGEGVAQMLRGEAVTAFDAGFFAPGRFSVEGAWSGRFGL